MLTIFSWDRLFAVIKLESLKKKKKNNAKRSTVNTIQANFKKKIKLKKILRTTFNDNCFC